jgi:hypothetical protein
MLEEGLLLRETRIHGELYCCAAGKELKRSLEKKQSVLTSSHSQAWLPQFLEEGQTTPPRLRAIRERALGSNYCLIRMPRPACDAGIPTPKTKNQSFPKMGIQKGW